MILLTTAAASGPATGIETLTTIHLALIGLLIVLTVIAIIYGARMKRARASADAASEERVEALEEGAANPAPTARAASDPTPEPVPTPLVPDAPARPVPAPAPAPTAAQGLYGLSDVKGLGPKAVGILATQGVDDLAALAALDPARAAAIDAGLGPLSGRLTRDRWVEQARLLQAGDRAGFEATFGKL